MKTLKQSFYSLSLIVLGIVFAIGVNIALAVWIGPSQNPPEGNVAEPLNVSSNTQILQGSKTIQGNQITDILYLGLGTAINGILGVNGITQFFSVPISAIFDGNVGIGTVSPSAGGEQDLKLDVEGAIGAKHYCDENGNNCSSAPLGGGGGWVEVTSNTNDFNPACEYRWIHTNESNGIPKGYFATYASKPLVMMDYSGGNYQMVYKDNKGISTGDTGTFTDIRTYERCGGGGEGLLGGMKFGNWESRSFMDIYQAITDGFVVTSSISDENNSVVGEHYGYTDSSSSPITLRTGSSRGDFAGGITM